MQNRSLRILIHVVGCLAFLALPYLFTTQGFAKLAELSYNSHEQRNLASHLLTIAFFYLNYYVLIPRLFFQRRYTLYGLVVVSVFFVIQAGLIVINQRGFTSASQPLPPPSERIDEGSFRQGPPPGPGPSPPFGEDRFAPPPNRPRPEQAGLPIESSQTFFLFVVSFLLSLILRINDRWQKTEREKLQTELSYLKAQINPHFLFNTLNSIYALAIEESPYTPDAIVELSAFLRYVTKEPHENQVLLAKEIDYIQHYIALQKLRLGDTATINFTTEGQAGTYQIAPLILISFIENAFKYGVNPEESSIITISLTIENNELHCHVFNRKVRVSQAVQTAGSGIGLTNTQARLNLLYPARHQLSIQNRPDDFIVDLFLSLS
jgi:hypothetical protein